MATKISKYVKQMTENVLLSACGISMIALMVYNDLKVDVPKDILKWQGYNVEGVEFTQIDEVAWWEGEIYRSSMPLSLENKESCEYWQIRRWGQCSFAQIAIPYKYDR